MRRWWAWCVLPLVVSARASAEGTCPAPEGGSSALAAEDPSARIEFLHRTIDEQAGYAKTWKWAWFGIGSATVAAGVVQAGVWAAGDKPFVRDANITDNLIVSSFAVTTPIISLLFVPHVESKAVAIDELLQRTAGGRAGTCEVLARVEELFAKGAAEESLTTGWLAYFGTIVGVSSLFSILAVEAATASNPETRKAHWENAVLFTTGGFVLTQLQIGTSPRGATTGYRRYLAGNLRRKSSTVSVSPMMGAMGVSLRLSF